MLTMGTLISFLVQMGACMRHIDIDTVVANGGSYILLGDSEAVATEKMLRNSQIRQELPDKLASRRYEAAVQAAHVYQYRLQEANRTAAAKFKADEDAKLLPRMFAWILVLVGVYFLLRILGGGFDMTPDPITPLAWLFWAWAAAWCLWGIETIMWMSGSSFAVLILLWILPFYICGPTLYLWESYTSSQSIKRVEGIA